MSVLQEYKCPCCGGAIEFDSATQKMKCPYCDAQFEPEALKSFDEKLQNDANSNMNWKSPSGGEWQEGEADGLRVYSCKSCGGEIVGDENTAATACPYCGNPVVMMGQFSGSLKPDIIIPFKLDKKAAKEGLMKHISKKRLLPKIFKDQNHIDEIKGVYVPFWLFDTDANAHINYKATKTRSWSDNNYNYVETSYFSALRGGNIGFENVPVDGSSKMPDELMESIEPFDISQAKPFATSYLAGYLADKYDVSAEQSVLNANERIEKSTQEAFAKTVTGYNSVIPESTNINLYNGRTKYALYPVWILNTTWKNKKYTFAMNGQTGKFVGDLPVDTAAATKLTIALSAAFSVASYGIVFLMHMLGIL